MLEEGLEFPPEAAVLTYFDPRRERHVTLIFPSRAAAEARAPSSRRARVEIRPLEEAVA